MNTSEQTDKVAPAWVRALQEVSDVTKDASGHHGRYATLPACLGAVKPVLTKRDLAVQQYNRPGADGRVVVVTRVWHTSGQWVEDEGLAMAAPNDPQKVGGAVTYARRYSLTTFFAISTEDDDGRSASDQIREEAERASDAVTDAQIKKMIVAFKAAGITDRDERLTYVVATVGREVASSKELTKDEASRVIDALEAVPPEPEQPELTEEPS